MGFLSSRGKEVNSTEIKEAIELTINDWLKFISYNDFFYYYFSEKIPCYCRTLGYTFKKSTHSCPSPNALYTTKSDKDTQKNWLKFIFYNDFFLNYFSEKNSMLL